MIPRLLIAESPINLIHIAYMTVNGKIFKIYKRNSINNMQIKTN